MTYEVTNLIKNHGLLEKNYKRNGRVCEAVFM